MEFRAEVLDNAQRRGRMMLGVGLLSAAACLTALAVWRYEHAAQPLPLVLGVLGAIALAAALPALAKLWFLR